MFFLKILNDLLLCLYILYIIYIYTYIYIFSTNCLITLHRLDKRLVIHGNFHTQKQYVHCWNGQISKNHDIRIVHLVSLHLSWEPRSPLTHPRLPRHLTWYLVVMVVCHMIERNQKHILSTTQSWVFTKNKPAAQTAGTDPSRWSSTFRQNQSIQKNRCNFWTNSAILMRCKI